MTNPSLPETLRRTRAAFDTDPRHQIARELRQVVRELRQVVRFVADFSQRPRLTLMRFADKLDGGE